MVIHQLFWVASRAFGTIAIVLLGTTVAVGLSMSGRLLRRPGLNARLRHLHEAAAIVTIGLIATHAGLLLLDTYLKPGLVGITVPFVLGYRTLFTGVGIIAGWLTVLFAMSFYVGRKIGARTWRRVHRFTIVAYFLALGHALGAGTDAGSPWMIATLTGLTAPIAFAFSHRWLSTRASGSTSLRPLPGREHLLRRALARDDRVPGRSVSGGRASIILRSFPQRDQAPTPWTGARAARTLAVTIRHGRPTHAVPENPLRPRWIEPFRARGAVRGRNRRRGRC